MRCLNSFAAPLRAVFVLAPLALAACGTAPSTEEASRIDASNLALSTTEIAKAAAKPNSAREIVRPASAQEVTFKSTLSRDVNAMLARRGLEADLVVESYMIPNEVQKEITGARAYLAVKVTLRNAVDGETLIKDATLTFVAPENGIDVMDENALQTAFTDHLNRSLRLR